MFWQVLLMSITLVNLQEEIVQSLQALPQEELQKVFEFVQSLQANSLFQKWDNISDEESQALKAEFAQEDIDFSENILADYLAHLKEAEKD
jgi:hypothetical protein